MSMQLITEDQCSPPAIYAPGPHAITKETIGTRYVLAAIRTLVDPVDPNDMKTAHAPQVEQLGGPGSSKCFSSISLYNADGYFQKNELNSYSLNNITSKKSADGSITIQFGGCDGKIPNCLPVMNG